MHYTNPQNYLVLFLFCLASLNTIAQNPQWTQVKSAGSSAQDEGTDIALDQSGNTFVTGSFQDTAYFGTTTLISNGDYDIFLAKYDTSGILSWARKAGGPSEDKGHAITVDDSGNTYITGHFEQTVAFGNNSLTSKGNHDIFVAKFDPAGNLRWANQAGGNIEDRGHGIAVDALGNVYVTGLVRDRATFGNDTITSNGEFDIFIAKYDASGKILWTQHAGGLLFDEGYDIAVDAVGNAYLTGEFQGGATFGNTSLSSRGADDVFVAKYDSAGNLRWAKKAGDIDSERGTSIAIDTLGNTYLTGWFESTAFFSGDTLISQGSEDIFIAKYDTLGNLSWVEQAGGQDTDEGYGIAVDDSGHTYITGRFYDQATFGSDTLTSGGFSDLFVAKYDTAGEVLWTQQASSGSWVEGASIALGPAGKVYVTGSNTGSSDFGSITLQTLGSSDMLVAQLDPNAPIVGIQNVISNTEIKLYPNPANDYVILDMPKLKGRKQLRLIDRRGKVLREERFIETLHQLSLKDLPKGMYFLHIQNKSQRTTQKILVE